VGLGGKRHEVRDGRRYEVLGVMYEVGIFEVRDTRTR
jgi:hypothetical protein